MKSFVTAASLLALAQVSLAQLTINTPLNVVQCQPSQLTWTGGVPPYFLSLIPGGQASAAPIKVFSQPISGTEFTWNVDLPTGTSFTLDLKDSSGTLAQSAPVTIGPGSDSSCINTSVTEGGSSTASGATSAAGPASTTGASSGATTPTSSGAATPTSSGAATPSATSPSTTGGSSSQSSKASSSSGSSSASAAKSASSSASSSSPSNGAASSLSAGTFGLAAVMGVVGAALF